MERFRISEIDEGESSIEKRFLTPQERKKQIEETKYQLITPEEIKKILHEAEKRFFSIKIKHLHFKDGLSQQEIADQMGVSVHTIYRVFKKEGLTPQRSTKKIDLDPQYVKQLYDSGLTQQEVAEKLSVSDSTIYRHFKKHGITPHRMASRAEVDRMEVHRLHLDEKLGRKEVAEKLGVSERTISRIYHDEGLEAYGQKKYETDEERELARNEIRKNTQIKIIELRKEIFGTKCQTCTEEGNIIVHRKDGSEHNPDELWRIHYLRNVNPNEYAAVCPSCHPGIHWMMDTYDQNWEQIKSQSLNIPISHYKRRESLRLPDESEPSSEDYQKIKLGFEGSEEELRRVLFGDSCHFCGAKYDEKQLYLHRKDYRPNHSDLTSKEMYFRTFDPNEWVFLCYLDHRGVHWAHKALGLEWDDLKRKESGAEGEI